MSADRVLETPVSVEELVAFIAKVRTELGRVQNVSHTVRQVYVRVHRMHARLTSGGIAPDKPIRTQEVHPT